MWKKSKDRLDWEEKNKHRMNFVDSVDLNFVQFDGRDYEVAAFGIEPSEFNCESEEDVDFVAELIKSIMKDRN